MMRNYGFVNYGFVFNEEVLKVFYYFNRDALKDEFGIEKYEDLSADDIISIIWDDLVVFAPDGSYEVNYPLRSKNFVEYLENYFVNSDFAISKRFSKNSARDILEKSISQGIVFISIPFIE